MSKSYEYETMEPKQMRDAIDNLPEHAVMVSWEKEGRKQVLVWESQEQMLNEKPALILNLEVSGKEKGQQVTKMEVKQELFRKMAQEERIQLGVSSELKKNTKGFREDNKTKKENEMTPQEILEKEVTSAEPDPEKVKHAIKDGADPNATIEEVRKKPIECILEMNDPKKAEKLIDAMAEGAKESGTKLEITSQMVLEASKKGSDVRKALLDARSMTNDSAREELARNPELENGSVTQKNTGPVLSIFPKNEN